jgi:hypothetical protein
VLRHTKTVTPDGRVVVDNKVLYGLTYSDISRRTHQAQARSAHENHLDGEWGTEEEVVVQMLCKGLLCCADVSSTLYVSLSRHR